MNKQSITQGKTMDVLYLDEAGDVPRLFPATITATDSDGKTLFTKKHPVFVPAFPRKSKFGIGHALSQVFPVLPSFLYEIPGLRCYVREWYDKYMNELINEREIPIMKLADSYVGVYTPLAIHLDIPEPKRVKPHVKIREYDHSDFLNRKDYRAWFDGISDPPKYESRIPGCNCEHR